MEDGSFRLDGLSGGVFHGFLSGDLADQPSIDVRFGEKIAVAAKFEQVDGGWIFTVPVPAQSLNDGITSVRFIEPGTGQVLARHVLAAGSIVPGDIEAELADLRTELSLLKRAFLDFAADPPLRLAERPLLLAEARQAAIRALAETKRRT